MELVVVSLFILWVYPVISFFLIRKTKGKASQRKRLLLYVSLWAAIALLSILTKVSTISTIADWIIISGIFFLINIMIWWFIGAKQDVVKFLGWISAFAVFGLTLLSSTVGILGLFFVLSDLEPDYETRLQDGITIQQYNVGNAISDHRGRRIELYKTVWWLPFLENMILEKDYEILIDREISTSYDKEKLRVYLSPLWFKSSAGRLKSLP